jgi:hypothetical protein
MLAACHSSSVPSAKFVVADPVRPTLTTSGLNTIVVSVAPVGSAADTEKADEISQSFESGAAFSLCKVQDR